MAIWTALKTPFSAYGRAKGPLRLIADQATRHLSTNLNRRQLRALFGTTRKAYDDFMKSEKLPPLVEDVGEGAKLLWIGPKSNERVILHFHGAFLDLQQCCTNTHVLSFLLNHSGGAFLIACVPSSPALWWHMKKKFKQRGKEVDIAMLQYSE